MDQSLFKFDLIAEDPTTHARAGVLHTPHGDIETPIFMPVAAESGKQAIDIVGNQQIDLVLLDIEMPDMDGFQTLEEIRKITDVPVIFVTAYKDYKLIERARQMGVEDYITKPFLPIVFLETLYGVIG